MGLQTAPAYIGSGSFAHPATLDRAVIKQLTGRQSGCFGSGDFVVAPTTGLNVTITAGAVSILGVDIPASQGHYFAWSDATETLACVAAHASLKRIDALILRVVDPSYSAGPTPEARWTWISGSPNASPVAPTDSDIQAGGNYRPGSWIRIANVQINNGDTVVDPSRIFDTRTWTIGANGVQLVKDSASRPVSNLLYGDKIWQLSDGLTFYWDGAAWQPSHGAGTPRGVLMRGNRQSDSTATTTEVGVLRLDDQPIIGGRAYRISTGDLSCNSTNSADVVWPKLRATFDASTPTTSSTMFGSVRNNRIVSTAENPIAGPIVWYYYPAVNETLSVLLTVARHAGAGSVRIIGSATAPIELIIEDIGLAVADTGTDI